MSEDNAPQEHGRQNKPRRSASRPSRPRTDSRAQHAHPPAIDEVDTHLLPPEVAGYEAETQRLDPDLAAEVETQRLEPSAAGVEAETQPLPPGAGRAPRRSGNSRKPTNDPSRAPSQPSRPFQPDARGEHQGGAGGGPESRRRDPRNAQGVDRTAPPAGPYTRDRRSAASQPNTSLPPSREDARANASYGQGDDRSARDKWNERAAGWDNWDDRRNDGWAESVERLRWRNDQRRRDDHYAAHDVWTPARQGREAAGAAGTLGDRRETSRQRTVSERTRLFGTRRRRSIAIGLLIVLMMAILGSIPATVFALGQYHQASAIVKDSLTHVKNAETDAKALQKNPFDITTIAALRGELVAAHADFTQVSAKLAPIPGALDIIPIAGSKLAGAQRLVPIAVEGTAAGITACDALTILASALKNPLDSTSKGLTPQATIQLQADVDQIVATFDEIVPQVNDLQPSDLSLDPRLGPMLAGFKTDLPKIAQMVAGAQVFAHLAPQLLGVGQPANYLIEVMDSTELRPGGGFIGNYGILSLNGGTLPADPKVLDVDLLDHAAKYGNLVIHIPSQYGWMETLFPSWSFRDSNLDADFATSAQNGESLYAQELQYDGTKPDQLQGVIAITPQLIANAIKNITGNIEVTDYPTRGHTEVVTPDNLIDKIHYYALGVFQGADTVYDSRCGTSLRKCFTGLLFKAFMAKMKQDLAGNFGKFGQLFTDALHTKDIQIYLNPSAAEKVLHDFSLDSRIGAPPTGDSLFEVDANIGGNKSNYFLTYNMSDQITLNAAGDATHHLVFTYKWPYNPDSLIKDYPCQEGCLSDRYVSYSRLYLPPRAVVKAQSGWVDPGSGTAFGRKELSGTTYVYYDDSLTVAFDYTVPHAATHDASGWHYDLLWQKQAGVTWQMSEQVTLPSCATLTGKPVGFTTTSGKSVSAKEPLLNDVQLAVDYRGC